MKRYLLRRESTCSIFYDRGNGSWRHCPVPEGDSLASRPDTQVIDYSATTHAGTKVALGAPVFLFLDITNACTCQCWYCYNASGKALPGELTGAEIQSLIERFAELGGVELRLAGGEPTLRPNLAALLEQSRAAGLRTILVSNGLIPKPRLERLAAIPITAWYLSIQGDEATNDSIRGQGSYRRCVESAKYLTGCGVRVRLSMVFHKQNRHCVPAVAELAAGIGAGVAFNPLRPLGRATPAMMLTQEEHQRLVTEIVGLRAKYPGMRIDTPWDYLAEPPGPLEHTPFKRLGCGQSGLSVTADGQCYACGQLSATARFCVGSVRSSDLAEIWTRSRATCPMVNASLPQECQACPYLDRSECFGGCAATALAARGALDAGDPYCFVKLVAGGPR